MAIARFEEKMKDKTRDELLELCFQALLEAKLVKLAQKGELAPQRPASAPEGFKKKPARQTARGDGRLMF